MYKVNRDELRGRGDERGNKSKESVCMLSEWEGTYCMEHWVLYANNESWNIISKTKDVLYGD